VVGEMIGSGGQWGLQMGLAPHERQGQYQGFAGLGFSVIAVVGPPVVTLLCVEMGEAGWLVLAALMLAVAAVSVPVSRWALASRERYGVLTHSG
jgi:MFS family permease